MPITSPLLMLFALLAAAAPDPGARLKVTHRDLVPECLDGVLVAAGRRSWTLPPGRHSMTLTMRRDVRNSGVPDAGEPGRVALAFDAHTGHRYEVEVRADAEAFSSRRWKAGSWTPVVRDRTVEGIVSSVVDLPSCGGGHH